MPSLADIDMPNFLKIFELVTKVYRNMEVETRFLGSIEKFVGMFVDLKLRSSKEDLLKSIIFEKSNDANVTEKKKDAQKVAFDLINFSNSDSLKKGGKLHAIVMLVVPCAKLELGTIAYEYAFNDIKTQEKNYKQFFKDVTGAETLLAEIYCYVSFKKVDAIQPVNSSSSSQVMSTLGSAASKVVEIIPESTAADAKTNAAKTNPAINDVKACLYTCSPERGRTKKINTYADVVASSLILGTAK